MNNYKSEWVAEDRARVERMDELFRLDGRDDPSPPHAHTYTGLYQEILIYEKWRRQYGY